MMFRMLLVGDVVGEALGILIRILLDGERRTVVVLSDLVVVGLTQLDIVFVGLIVVVLGQINILVVVVFITFARFSNCIRGL